MRAAGEGGGARGNMDACGAIVWTFPTPNVFDAATMHTGHDLISVRTATRTAGAAIDLKGGFRL